MAAVSSVGEDPGLRAGGLRPHGMPASRRRKLNLFRTWFSPSSGCSSCCRCLRCCGSRWRARARHVLGDGVDPDRVLPLALLSAIEITLELAVITCAVVLVLLVPTMIWIRLGCAVTRLFEFLCLLPLTIPAIVLVVGLGPIYNRIRSTTTCPRCSCSGSTSSWRCPTPTGRWPQDWTRST